MLKSIFHQINYWKDNNPDNIHKVPVQTTAFNINGMSYTHFTRKGIKKPPQEPKDTNRNMGTMSTRKHIECGTKNMGLTAIGR